MVHSKVAMPSGKLYTSSLKHETGGDFMRMVFTGTVVNIGAAEPFFFVKKKILSK